MARYNLRNKERIIIRLFKKQIILILSFSVIYLRIEQLSTLSSKPANATYLRGAYILKIYVSRIDIVIYMRHCLLESRMT